MTESDDQKQRSKDLEILGSAGWTSMPLVLLLVLFVKQKHQDCDGHCEEDCVVRVLHDGPQKTAC